MVIPLAAACKPKQQTNSSVEKVSSVFANTSDKKTQTNMNDSNTRLDTATFGAGCFWCVEAVFQDLKGVKSVACGYSGGKIKNPTYREVCSGLTGHAEVIQIAYNPDKISFDELLEVFWQTHDPTTLNQQGADRGTQYRSVVFYHNEEQKVLAEKYKKALNDSQAFANPVVTEISAYTEFYKAEDYHQNYFNENGEEPYCRMVIKPKVDKFKKVFKDKLKKEAAQ
ncbi:MAG: peptide-methionine (S)-S-oxide reductase MsrA [Bacteroidetes bacterium]|nr:MAG: peptide-methionine (S)-S-oxide reductase MsrA [Bacteroidota bacterium]